MCPTKQAKDNKTAFAVLFLLFEARKQEMTSMKLEDIKLGMTVLITKDAEKNGWEKLNEDLKEKFIGKTGAVIGIRMPFTAEIMKGPVISVQVITSQKLQSHWTNSFPLSSLEPCISAYCTNVGDTILFMNGSQQEVGTILQYGVEKENGNNKDCHLFVEIKKDNGDIKYAMISSNCVIGKADPNKSIHY